MGRESSLISFSLFYRLVYPVFIQRIAITRL
nr:MAG TPA: hypothetical protein [Bacteriophage sp.]